MNEREFVTFNECQGVVAGTFFWQNGKLVPINQVPEGEMRYEFDLFRNHPVTSRTINKLRLQGLKDMRSLYERVASIHFRKLDKIPDVTGNQLNIECDFVPSRVEH